METVIKLCANLVMSHLLAFCSSSVLISNVHAFLLLCHFLAHILKDYILMGAPRTCGYVHKAILMTHILHCTYIVFLFYCISVVN